MWLIVRFMWMRIEVMFIVFLVLVVVIWLRLVKNGGMFIVTLVGIIVEMLNSRLIMILLFICNKFNILFFFVICLLDIRLF